MSNDGPKLYDTKPKKSQLKQHQKLGDMSTPTPNPPPPPTPINTSSSSSSSSSTLPPHKESFARRYKFIWPVLLAVNFSIGAYLFMRTKKKDKSVEDVVEVPEVAPAATVEKTTAPDTVKPYEPPVSAEPAKKVQEVIPEEQQREIYKWMLEEKRKVKPKNSEEKKKLDEEKDLLKQVIRAKSLPSI